VQLINDLLDVSRIINDKMRLEMETVELTSIIKRAVEAIRPSAVAKNLVVETSIAPLPILMHGDPERLQQIAWNLLSNAVKFTPEGGQVHVQLGIEGNQIELEVRDTGKGIAPEFLSQVFGRFRQADQTSTRSYGGLGLGLSIVYQLVELHGGTITAASEGESLGATFRVYLPLLGEHTEAKRNRSSDESDETITRHALHSHPQLAGLRILVVDDELDTREMLRLTLESCGSHVRTAGSVTEALELFGLFEPDVLVSDIGLPNEDGYSLIAKVRSLETKDGKVVAAMALTAYVAEEDRIRALDAGFQVHVPKPIDAGVFVQILCKLVTPT
jgi:CheY-like chemotaxis protein/two-component sensor histidine kinase